MSFLSFFRLDKGPPRDNLCCVSEVVQYLTDEDGKKTAVVLPITEYEKLLEDLDDLPAIVERRKEPTFPGDQFKTDLRRDAGDQRQAARRKLRWGKNP